MIRTIAIIGKPASGKSSMMDEMSRLLQADGYKVLEMCDRYGLEDAVLADTHDALPDNNGVRIGPHSKLIQDGPRGQRKIHVLDGSLLNQVHRDMIHVAATNTEPTIVLMEIAIGPIAYFGEGKEPLLQHAAQLVDNLANSDHLQETLIIDVEAPLSIRAAREAARADAMAPETFAQFFPDGGEMSRDYAELLGDGYVRLDNGYHSLEGYKQEAYTIYTEFISPQLPQEFGWREGAIPLGIEQI